MRNSEIGRIKKEDLRYLEVDNDIFYQNYGKFVIEVLDKFVF
jgi:hypothetical protein